MRRAISKHCTFRLHLGLALALLPAGAFGQTLKSSLVASGFVYPTVVTAPAGDFERLFVVEQDGRIRIVRNGVVLATPFLDIDADVNSSTREQGLLGLAFHPQYATNGKYYVMLTDNTNASVVREYVASATPGLNVDVSDTLSFTDVFGPFPRMQPNHNAGCLQFGPDGKLYVSLGDGGGAYDNGLGHDVGGNGQSLATELGKILRIDVDAGPPYDPGDNPWSSDTDGVPDLVWAMGLRNPWRFSFDRDNGDLYIGDVGQSSWEEVDYATFAQAAGANFGWRCQEALHCTSLGPCTCNTPPGTNPALTDPVVEYGHTAGNCAVIGGYVYRGSWIPWLRGTYFYSDYCSHKIQTFQMVSGLLTNPIDRTAELDPPGPDVISFVTSFGEDARGELYVATNGGAIYRFEQVCPGPVNYCVAAPNSTGAGAILSTSGTPYISQNDLVIECSGLPHNTNGYFFYGQGHAQTSLGDGFLCIASSHVRLPVTHASPNGIATRGFDVLAPPHVVDPGELWSFQFYYRNVTATGAGFNLSDAIEVTFCY